MGTLDIRYLEDLVRQEDHIQPQHCATLEQLTSRRMVTHSHGIGRLQKIGCSVYMCSFIPLNLMAHPYAIFYSRGKHTHPPPPPNKPPQLILDEVIALVKENQGPNLTASMFLKSPALKEFFKKNRSKTLSEIHISFANIDRLTAIIAKQRALSFFQGRGFNGTLFDYENKPDCKDYIRRIYTDEAWGSIIICALDSQLRIWGGLDTFEVNISFKRVNGDFNEVIFATYLPQHGRIVTLCRAFMNQESPLAYQMLFTYVLQLLEDVLEAPTNFYHLHNRGFKAIVVDMCYQQMKGLGLYLQEQDIEHKRDWKWQCQSILIFCRMHFMRTVSKLIPTQEGERFQFARTRLINLLYCESKDDYLKLIQLIIDNQPWLRDWAIHKRHPVIAAGLCQACSLMKPEFWSKIRLHTSAVEQSHYKSYFMGTYTSLLGAIHGSRPLDECDAEQCNVRVSSGIDALYRSNSREARLSREVTTISNKRQRQRDEDEDSPDDEILLATDSLGHIHPSRHHSRSSHRSRNLRRTSIFLNKNDDIGLKQNV
ncbi:hypothetical protein N7523_000075 [Penicillium sp. IBT 18751x]|nr:hypothetical protein N7523_000075 [Penicillium sp. IBT 18751x]